MIKLLKLISEIKIFSGNIWKDPKWVKRTIEKLKAIDNAPKLNIHIGKYDVDKGQQGFRYTWDEAIQNKKIGVPTTQLAKRIFDTLGVIPEEVCVGYMIFPEEVYAETIIPQQSDEDEKVILNKYKSIYPKSVNNKSTYILGHYNNEPIIVAQRQTKNDIAGQPYIYSKYAKLSNTHGTWPKPIEKETLLKALKIKND